ncbi:MAG: DNA-directed RNA polymerase subunit alpha C-terminal domain-containing protein [Lachnospiraceae bacterium]
MTIDDLDLTVRAYNVLKRAGVETIESLDLMKDAELLEIKRFNEKCLKDVKERLRLFKSGKHWECKYCDYYRGVPYRDEPEFLVCGRCGAEWLDCMVLVPNEEY